MRRWRGILASLIVVALAGAVLWVLVFKPVTVVAHELARGDVMESIPGTGAIECPRVVSAGFELTGRIVELLADQGDAVVKGQQLARIDAEVYRAEEAAAVQEVELVRAALARLRSDIKRAEAQQQGAAAHVKRQEDAFRGNIISRDVLDQAIERARVAEADLERANAAMVEGEQSLAAAERALEVARARLQRTILRSPLDGIVLLRLGEPGDVAVPGGAVLRIGDNSSVWASVWVDETFLPALKPGQAASVVLRSSPGIELQAEVLRIGREVDRETRELLVDLVLRDVPELLAVGQRADAQIHGSTSRNVVRAPSEFLVMRSDGAFVWQQIGGKAVLREVVVGLRGREWVEISSGVAAGDVILRPTPGARAALRDGARVAAVESAR
jgi:HlyD family secretion protein